MERGSDKHGPRLDEELKHVTRSIVRGAPVEARADERREQEGPADGDPTPDSRVRGPDADQEVELRADLARYLAPSVFPARTGEVVESARENHAPQWVVRSLEALADDRFENVRQVWEAVRAAGAGPP
ncbi:MAG: DUF2795 domain-containing protein [Actinomycetota bacterium]